MGVFDQLKIAKEALKDMSSDDIKQLMSQAQDSKQMLEEMVERLVTDEIQKRGLVTRDTVRAMIAESRIAEPQQ